MVLDMANSFLTSVINIIEYFAPFNASQGEKKGHKIG